ncbi:MAG: hypothetical protein L3K04_02800 [Thermoplasmata archaeon]|nr:hypothetical protein [Thermoplasmata archaeon]MCI4340762.1 hypothetical protein [Thermoplasmata archaeon]
METKHPKGAKKKSETVTDERPKVVPTAKEEALAEIDRAVDPIIRSWRQATREGAQAKAEKFEAAYNKALDAATLKYERWCKAHGEVP